MSQDLIGCRKRRKLNALIPRLVVFVNDPPSAERKIDFGVFFIVLWSYGRNICINMYHGNSENSYGCSYLLWICFIYGTNVIVSRSWIPLQVVDREQGAFWFTNKLASHAGVFRGDRFSSLPTNACSTEDNIPFRSLANHFVLSEFWEVDLDRKVIWWLLDLH